MDRENHNLLSFLATALGAMLLLGGRSRRKVANQSDQRDRRVEKSEVPQERSDGGSNQSMSGASQDNDWPRMEHRPLDEARLENRVA